jgi:hypothetical protein
MLHRGHECRQWTDDGEWRPWNDGIDEEVDLITIIDECDVDSTAEAQAMAVEIDRLMVEHGRTHYLEARQLVLMDEMTERCHRWWKCSACDGSEALYLNPCVGDVVEALYSGDT